MSETAGFMIMMGLMFAGCMVQGGLDNVARQIPHTCVETKH